MFSAVLVHLLEPSSHSIVTFVWHLGFGLGLEFLEFALFLDSGQQSQL